MKNIQRSTNYFPFNVQTRIACLSLLCMVILAANMGHATADEGHQHESTLNSTDSTTVINTDNVPLPKIRFVKESEITPTKATPPPESRNDSVIMKKAPGYQFNKIDPATQPKQRYQKAIQLELDPNWSPAQKQQAAEQRCRYYSESQRQNYFVNIINNRTKEVMSAVLCKNVAGPIISDQQAPQQPDLKAVIQKEVARELEAQAVPAE